MSGYALLDYKRYRGRGRPRRSDYRTAGAPLRQRPRPPGAAPHLGGVGSEQALLCAQYAKLAMQWERFSRAVMEAARRGVFADQGAEETSGAKPTAPATIRDGDSETASEIANPGQTSPSVGWARWVSQRGSTATLSRSTATLSRS